MVIVHNITEALEKESTNSEHFRCGFSIPLLHPSKHASLTQKVSHLRYKGIWLPDTKRYKGNTNDLQSLVKGFTREALRGTFCVRGACFEGRRSASNQYFLTGFFLKCPRIFRRKRWNRVELTKLQPLRRRFENAP